MPRKTANRNTPLRAATLLVLLVGSLNSSGQGILDFANSGEGVHAPISGPNGLLGVGFFAQLQSADGSFIGEPAQFRKEGFFSGGNRVVPGTTPGQSVSLQVFIYNLDQSKTGTTDLFRVTLGDQDTPGTLINLKPFSLPEQADIYQWTNPFTFPGNLIGLDEFFCRWVGMGGIEFTAIIPVDDCFCAGLPFPGEPKQNPAPCDQEESESETGEVEITYTITNDGTLELRWPASTTLFRSTQIDGRGEEFPVEAMNANNGENVQTFPMSKQLQFFWLE